MTYKVFMLIRAVYAGERLILAVMTGFSPFRIEITGMQSPGRKAK